MSLGQSEPLHAQRCLPKLFWNTEDGKKEGFSSAEQKYSIESGDGLAAVNQGFYSFSCQLYWRVSGIPNLENKSCAVGFRFSLLLGQLLIALLCLEPMRQCCNI